jgi:hypothetical protein
MNGRLGAATSQLGAIVLGRVEEAEPEPTGPPRFGGVLWYTEEEPEDDEAMAVLLALLVADPF